MRYTKNVHALRMLAIMVLIACIASLASAQGKSRTIEVKKGRLERSVIFKSHPQGPMKALNEAGLSVNFLPHVRCNVTGQRIAPSQYRSITCKQLRVDAGVRPGREETRQLLAEAQKSTDYAAKTPMSINGETFTSASSSVVPVAVTTNYAELQPLELSVGSKRSILFKVVYSDGSVRTPRPIIEATSVGPQPPSSLEVIRVVPYEGLAEVEAVKPGASKLALWTPDRTQKFDISVSVNPIRPSPALLRYNEWSRGDWATFFFLMTMLLLAALLAFIGRADRRIRQWYRRSRLYKKR